MAAIYELETQFHAGEQEMHKLLNIVERDNPTSPYLAPYAANILSRSPLIALGTLDDQGRPWSTVWGGELGFAQPFAASLIGVESTVASYDPVLEAISQGKAEGEIFQGNETTGMMISGLAVDLEHRRRVKLFGRLVGGTLSAVQDGAEQVHLVVKIEQSLGGYWDI